MPSPRAHRDLAWLSLMALPALLTLVAWMLSWPMGVAFALATVGAVVSAVLLWRLVLVPRRRVRAELDEQVQSLWRELVPGEPQPAPGEGEPTDQALRSLNRLRSMAGARSQLASMDLSNLRAILDAAATPLLATNAAGEVLVGNVAADEFFARPAGSLVGRSIEELFTQAEVLGLHASALAGKPRQGQVRLQRPDGQRVYQVLTAPVSLRLGDGSPQVGVVLSLRDVTELAQAVQLKTDFVANASHELRTPLSSIKAAVETLSDGAWEDETMRSRLAGMISGNVGRLEDMVRDLLDLSRLESPDAPVTLQSVSLSDIVAGLAEDFAPVCQERRIKLSFEVDPSVERLSTDPKLLTLILKNLIDNAAKFAYEDTTVRVGASPLPGGGAPGVRIQVSDRGVGIPIAQQQRVFERFFQVDPARTGFAHRRGTGLGLAIVKHAVKALGGAISVESLWKKGTTMTVEIPGCVEAQGDSEVGGIVTGA